MAGNRYKTMAGDARAGTFARRKARQDQRAYIHKNWRWLLGGYVVLVAAAATPLLFTGSDFWRGLWLGLILAGFAGLLATTVVIQTGTGPTMAGELAEQWTAQELRPLASHGYRLANHVNVDGRGDADHVLVGPGGLFVLETKWSATAWTDDRFFRQALHQVQARARSTWLQLKPHGIAHATPVLVLWGQAAKPLSAATGVRKNGDVVVVAGSHLRKWLLSRAPGVLDRQQIEAAFDDVCSIARRADKHEAPVPPSLPSLFCWGASAVATWTASLLLSFWTFQYGWLVYGVSTTLLLALGGVLATRCSRWLGVGVLAGAASSLLLLVGASIYDAVG
jgi:hypothetical protein